MPVCRSGHAARNAALVARRQRTSSILRAPVQPYYRDLVGKAEELRAEGRYDLAVVVAQTACELLFEQAITELLQRRGVPELEMPLSDLLTSYSPTNDKTRKRSMKRWRETR
jgi:hypothetical protein